MNTQQLISIGKASGQLNRLPEQIREAALALGVTPAFQIDGRDYFTTSDVDRIASHFRLMQVDAGGVAARASGIS